MEKSALKKNGVTLAITILALLWVAAIVILFYVSHKPLTPSVALALVLAIWRLAIAGIILSLSGAIGNKLAPLPDLDGLARLAVQAILGLGVMAVAIFLIGSTLGLPFWLFWLLPPLIAVFFWRALRSWWKQCSSIGSLWKQSSQLSKVVLVMLALIFLSALLTALAPPLQYDALMYHLTLPQTYLDQGRISYLPWLVMSGMPQLGEMLYLFAMALGGAQASAVLGWGLAVLVALGLCGYLRSRLSLDAAMAGVGSLFAGYTLAVSPAWAYVDWFGLAAGFACLVTLDLWIRERAKKLALLAGAFAGMAFASKYTAGVLLLAAGISFLIHIRQLKRKLFPNLFWFSLGALGFILPWIIRNALATGNPFYPFFLPGGAMDSLRIGVYQGLPAWGNWQDLVLLPLRATLIGIDGAEGYSVSLGPLLLGLGALSFVGWRLLLPDQKGSLKNAAFIGISGLIIWAIGNQFSGYLIQTRMYFSLLPAFAVMAAFGWQALSEYKLPQVRIGRLLAALLILVLSLTLIESSLVPIRSSAAPTVLGVEDEQVYLPNNLGWYALAMQAVRELPEGSRTLLLYEPRGYYCLPDCDPDEILDENMHSLAQYGSADLALLNWQELGFTHVLYYRAGADFLRSGEDPHHNPADIVALETMLATLPEHQSFGGVYELYAIGR